MPPRKRKSSRRQFVKTFTSMSFTQEYDGKKVSRTIEGYAEAYYDLKYEELHGASFKRINNTRPGEWVAWHVTKNGETTRAFITVEE